MHATRFLAVVLLTLALHPNPARSQIGVVEPAAPPELAGLDAYIEAALEAWEIPGVGIAVVQDDSVIFAAGYGVRTVGTGETVDEHTLFAIASTTKAMTVAGLGMLVDEDAVDWDDPVRDHLQAFELWDPYVTRHVTLRDLLVHRTGVSRSDNLWYAAPFDRDEVVRRARFLPQSREFRYGYGYSNIMYMVAGEVLEAAAGEPWADFLEDRLFAPLEMERSTPRLEVVAERANVASSHVRQGDDVVAVPHRDYGALGPAGSVFSSAHDMANWVRMHLNHGTFEGRRLLDSATVAEMHEPQIVIGIDSVRQRLIPSNHFRAYGLGWRLEDYHGHKIVQHTGWLNWMRTQVGMIPEEGIGVVVLTNLTSSELQTALMYRVFDALLGLPEKDWSALYLELDRRSAERAAERAAEAEAARVEGTSPSLPLDAYAGTYADSLYGEVEIRLEDGRLVADYTPDYYAPLEHWHFDTFRADWRRAGVGTALLTFELDARGGVEAVEIGGFTSFRRVRDGGG